MPSVYLSGGDLALYGVPNATTAQITQASTTLDTYLRRPEGLVWAPDGLGQPCYMAALSPTYSFTLNSSIADGQNVAIPLTGPTMMLQGGDVLILDRATPAKTEACIVQTAINGAITLQNVIYAHSAASLAEYGLVIEEQRFAPKNRPIVNLSKTPLMRIVGGVGRYGYGRRGDDGGYDMDQFNLLAAMSKFGGPPAWELFAPSNTGIDVATGQVWLPAGIMLAYYSEVKLRYVAGFSAAALPSAIKMACASLIGALAQQGTAQGVKSYRAGDTQIENFVNSILDNDMLMAIQPYAARMFV